MAVTGAPREPASVNGAVVEPLVGVADSSDAGSTTWSNPSAARVPRAAASSPSPVIQAPRSGGCPGVC